jgi:hypothetical protein
MPVTNEMVRLRQSWVPAFTLAGALALLSGCGQSEGGRCEIDSDCAGGLYCAATPSPHNGVCRPKTGTGTGGTTGQTSVPEVPVTPEVDASVEPDTAAPVEDFDGGILLTD